MWILCSSGVPSTRCVCRSGERYECNFVCVYVCIYIRMYVCMYIRMYIYIYVCMYVCMYHTYIYCRWREEYLCQYIYYVKHIYKIKSLLEHTFENVDLCRWKERYECHAGGLRSAAAAAPNVSKLSRRYLNQYTHTHTHTPTHTHTHTHTHNTHTHTHQERGRDKLLLIDCYFVYYCFITLYE